MGKNKKNNNKIRNLIRILIIFILGLLVSFILCKKEASADNKVIEKTANDAFALQSLLIVHNLEPNTPSDYTDISTLENSNDNDSFVSDMEIKTGSSQYYIRVNYGANCVTIYKKDDDGNYTKPYKSMICSTGKATPKSGTYKITYKYRWLSLYGGVYGQYSTRIVKSILFHSVPYFEQRADQLEYEEYDKLGTTASAGCIRLTVQDAKWIYDNITSGTYVEFYSDTTNPGPLGKPKAQKISNNTKYRNWDPTDPDINNPWNGGSGIPSVTYTTPKKSTTTNSKNSTKNNTTKKTNTYTKTSTPENSYSNPTTSSTITTNEDITSSQNTYNPNQTSSTDTSNSTTSSSKPDKPLEQEEPKVENNNTTTPNTSTPSTKPEPTPPAEDKTDEKEEPNTPKEDETSPKEENESQPQTPEQNLDTP